MRYVLTAMALFSVGFAGLLVADGAFRAPSEAHALADAGGYGLEDFMLVVHGPKGLRAQVQEALGGSGPADEKAWKAVKARAATINYLTEQVLMKAKPEKGDAASWKAKTGDYHNITKALAKAAGAKDSEGLKAELAKLGKTCESCHKAHK